MPHYPDLVKSSIVKLIILFLGMFGNDKVKSDIDI